MNLLLNMGILQEHLAKLPTDWRDILLLFLKTDIEDKYLEQSMFEMYPLPKVIFRCFDYFDIKSTKVVILGQDPYHGPGQATGLCFGVENGIRPPPSLKNIGKLLKSDLKRELSDYTLENWAKQGILLLNTALTVQHKSPCSHMKWWSPFTEQIIDYLNDECKGIVFVAWGAFAYKKLAKINTKKHHLLVSSHPSPLSYSRTYGKFPSFKDSKVFSRINAILDEPIEF